MKKRKQIRLRTAALEQKRLELGLNKGELAEKLGLARPTVYRCTVPQGNVNYDKPGERFVVAVLTAFPEAKFEEFFYLE